MAVKKIQNTNEEIGISLNNGVPIDHVYIGIDTGVHTGFAVWSAVKQKFIELRETKIHRAMFKVLSYAQSKDFLILGVRVEDARLRSVDKNNPIYRQRLQSSGSVKRDASVWEDFLKDYKKYFPYQMVAPQSNKTKVSQQDFYKLCGEDVKSEHVRDACMLVYKLENTRMLNNNDYQNGKEKVPNRI